MGGRHPAAFQSPLAPRDFGERFKELLKFKVEPGNVRDPEDRRYAWLKDEWTLIPPEKIVRLTAKPCDAPHLATAAASER